MDPRRWGTPPRDVELLRRPGDLEAEALLDTDFLGMPPAPAHARRAQSRRAPSTPRASAPPHTHPAPPSVAGGACSSTRHARARARAGRRWGAGTEFERRARAVPPASTIPAALPPSHCQQVRVCHSMFVGITPRTQARFFLLARGSSAAQAARMPGGMDSTGLAVGLKKGFIVEKRTLAPKPANRKGVRAAASQPAPGPRAHERNSVHARRRGEHCCRAAPAPVRMPGGRCADARPARAFRRHGRSVCRPGPALRGLASAPRRAAARTRRRGAAGAAACVRPRETSRSAP